MEPEIKVLGVSGSIRARLGEEEVLRLLDDLAAVPEDELVARLGGEMHKRAKGQPSNSELCALAALWGCREGGASVESRALKDSYAPGCAPGRADALMEEVRASDGVLLSTPTYFGDRSSLAMKFIEDMRRAALDNGGPARVFGGLAVGAKRNGGQETTLIYQMIDAMNLGFLGVGNDYVTTSQYGGAGHAGNPGSMVRDELGLRTCAGTGRRVAQVARTLARGRQASLPAGPRVGLWMLQEKDGAAGRLLEQVLAGGRTRELVPIDLMDKRIAPCRACDVCPSRITVDEDYRCLVKGNGDDMESIYPDLLRADIIVPIVHSPRERAGLKTVYQEFMERTRFMRRGDYVFSNRLVVPLVFEEIGSKENIHIRMLTSFIRHHTVMHHPVICWLHEGVPLNLDEVRAQFEGAVEKGLLLTKGRLVNALNERESVFEYNPIGYVLPNPSGKAGADMEKRAQMVQRRKEKEKSEALERLADITQ
jgi:multimeric flavodoxin WrbA